MLAWAALRDALLGGPGSKDVPRLPPELVLSIIQYAAVPDEHQNEHSPRARRQTLHHCSLVCKEWHYPAQNILYSRIEIGTCAALTALVRTLSSTSLAPIVREITAAGNQSAWEWSEGLCELVRLCPNLETLNLKRVIGINFNDLQQCRHLTSISAIRCIFRPLPGAQPSEAASSPGASTSGQPGIALPVTRLDLGSTTLPAECLPQGNAFANLRALALWLGPNRLAQSEESVRQLMQQVAPHLQMFTCEDRARAQVVHALPQMVALRLLDIWSFSPLEILSGLRHPISILHCNCISGAQQAPERRSAISFLGRLLRDDPPLPALTQLQQIRISFEKASERHLRFPELETACKEQHISLIYDERPTRGVHFDTEFWRLCTEIDEGIVEFTSPLD